MLPTVTFRFIPGTGLIEARFSDDNEPILLTPRHWRVMFGMRARDAYRVEEELMRKHEARAAA